MGGGVFYKALQVEADESLPIVCSYPRCSKDKLINTAGILMAKFSVQFNCIWLNGLMDFTESLEFTFISSHGCSVIDYVLINTSLKPFITNFFVGDYTISDHLPLILQLNFKILRPIPSVSPSMVLESPLKLSWNKLSSQKLQHVLNTNICIAYRSNILMILTLLSNLMSTWLLTLYLS
ncbi:hypothetical protein JRQ81_013075 [Phrynocephalus forsythii]|uniref:Endonuclease/exonuclease/phosphatase domain-containing protein n=1 Tax=Phrynocephalus forsythii TaxID=171643 RepID=A0A9Q0XYF6_9SAUR|nr:hypothetical protein JRQ81_013075 [Phrynocephalus forsythii]